MATDEVAGHSARPVEGWRGMLGEGAGATCQVDGGILRLVCHNAKRGSGPIVVPVSETDATQLSAHYDGAELIIEGERSGRFVVRVDGADETTVLMSVVAVNVGEPLKVRYKGGAFEGTTSSGKQLWSAADLGVSDERIASALHGKPFQPLGSGFGSPGHWALDEGSLDRFVQLKHAQWAAREKGRAEYAQRQAERSRAQTREDLRDSHFINPYTFVPLPQVAPARDVPPGHDRCTDERPLVRIEVTWRAVTPLATRTAYRHGDGGTGLAGSAVKGAIRSLHEALTGSCLRVVNLDARPAYREPLQAGQGLKPDDPASWRTLARVLKVTGPDANGEWTVTLEVARRTVWVPSNDLPLPLVSGRPCDPSHIRGTEGHDRVRRRFQVSTHPEASELALPSNPDEPDVEWIPMVSHAGARKKDHAYHVPLGQFRRCDANRRIVTVTSKGDVWQEYEAAAQDSLDQVRRRRGEPPDLAVDWDETSIGMRQEVRSALRGPDAIGPGHLFWVAVRGDDVTHLRAAYVWRRGAGDTAADRVPTEFHPCTHPADLCPSCQVFGGGGATSNETSPEADSDGHGYRGHVRLGPLLTGTAPERLKCAPLNAPRIGSGQFYLEPPARQTDVPRDKAPQREWGSAADTGGRRRLRGRKFYWPADPEAQRQVRDWAHPRWRAEQTPYGQGDRGQEADVWDAGTEFHQVITVVGLDRMRLGGLLATLRPDLLAGPTGEDWDRAVVRMGYGKPLGLGVMRAVRTAITLHTPGSRYGPAPEPPREVSDGEAAAWAGEFIESVGDDVRQTWPDLRAVTDPEHVWPESVSYPVDRWQHYPRPSRPAATTTYSFTFWKESVGGHHGKLVSLPRARDVDQHLPLDPRKEDE